MGIKNKIIEVNKYFRNKVLEGDYKFISCDEHTVSVLIDDEYNIELWIANTPKYHFEINYGSFLAKGINIKDGLIFTNQKDRLKAYRKLKPYLIEYKEAKLKKEKEAEIKKLQEELKKLSK